MFVSSPALLALATIPVRAQFDLAHSAPLLAEHWRQLFVNPANASFNYPSTTRLSFSLRYQTTGNGSSPQCIAGVMNWVHGAPPLSASSPSPPHQRLNPTSVPFPTTSPATPTMTTSAKSPSPPIQRTSSSTSVVLTNGRPLKPSLKSASSSIVDDMAAPGACHACAQSMPSTPAYGAKNVRFKEKDEETETETVTPPQGRWYDVYSQVSQRVTEGHRSVKTKSGGAQVSLGLPGHKDNSGDKAGSSVKASEGS
ncbi:hypothetical protein EDB85DRAFT_2246560 [Lactarius pseudohatsudake]|nr:hypothetical protein EDB85DRAFT_2246560 [Lactarius pseudohatsudake]